MVMKKYILDTTVCIALIKGNKKVLDTVYEKGRSNCSVSEITIAELLYGASKSGNPSHFNDVQYILDAFWMPLRPYLFSTAYGYSRT